MLERVWLGFLQLFAGVKNVMARDLVTRGALLLCTLLPRPAVVIKPYSLSCLRVPDTAVLPPRKILQVQCKSAKCSSSSYELLKPRCLLLVNH